MVLRDGDELVEGGIDGLLEVGEAFNVLPRGLGSGLLQPFDLRGKALVVDGTALKAVQLRQHLFIDGPHLSCDTVVRGELRQCGSRRGGGAGEEG